MYTPSVAMLEGPLVLSGTVDTSSPGKVACVGEGDDLFFISEYSVDEETVSVSEETVSVVTYWSKTVVKDFKYAADEDCLFEGAKSVARCVICSVVTFASVIAFVE